MTGRVILAATDGTDRSRAVLGRAELVAREWGARLALAHVRKPSHARFRLRLACTAPNELADALVRHGGRADDLYMLEGNPSDAIVALATSLGADLVVLGLHRARRVLDTLRMTTMERIALGVACPVLVAQRYPPKPYTRVLGALSFDPISAQGLRLAASFAPKAAFHAIHALPHAPTDTAATRTEVLGKAMAQRKAFLSLPGLPADMPAPEIVPGGVHEVLRYRMDEWHPDLLVIGSRSGRNPARLGNYARDLMRAPPTDILVTTPDLASVAGAQNGSTAPSDGS
ncbi:MAG: universal stress protein [Rhodobacteraceae bacterium]|nr:universal stress protein [Paracoccaceae bacterium]